MSPNTIPLCTESREILRLIGDDEARQLMKLGLATVVRDKAGRNRRVVLKANEAMPLTASARAQAADSYRGINKYTYIEHFEAAPATQMLKRYRPEVGDFVRWPNN